MATSSRARKEAKKRRRSSARVRAEMHGTGFFTSITLPEGWDLFKVTSTEPFLIDVLPYVLVNPLANPFAKDENREPLDPGDLHWERTYWKHGNIGPEDKSYCCLVKTFGEEKCPPCERRADMVKEGGHTKDEIRELWPSERQVMAVRPRTGEQKGKWCIWDVANFCFGKYLNARVKGSSVDGDDDTDTDVGSYDNFWDIEEGCSLRITPMENTTPNGKYFSFPMIDFVPRKKPLEIDLEDIPDLDAIPRLTPYKQFAKLFYGGVGSNGDEDEDAPARSGPPKRKGAKAKDEEEETEEEEEEEGDEEEEVDLEIGATVSHEDFGECEVTHISSDGSSIKIKDGKGKIHSAIDPADIELVLDEEEEEEEEEEAPKKKGGKKPPPKAKDEEEEEEEEGDEEEEEEEEEESEEEDEDEDETSDEEEEEEEEAPKKKGPTKPPAKKGGVGAKKPPRKR